MIIWSGLGFLPVLVMFVSTLLLSMAVPRNLFEAALIVSFLITATFSWFIGNRLNGQKGHTVIDKQSGEEITIRQKHTLFWIKMQYWAFIALALAIITAIQTYA